MIEEQDVQVRTLDLYRKEHKEKRKPTCRRQGFSLKLLVNSQRSILYDKNTG